MLNFFIIFYIKEQLKEMCDYAIPTQCITAHPHICIKGRRANAPPPSMP